MTAIEQGAGHPPPETDAGPNWLSEDERAAWIRLVSVFIKLPAALDAQLQRDAGISNFEYMVLSQLSEAEKHTLRMSDLASMASGSHSKRSAKRRPRSSRSVPRSATSRWRRSS